MKTIIYYGNVLYPNLDAASHRTIGCAKALRHLGYKVILVGTRKGEYRPLLETLESYEGFDIYYYPDPITSRQWRDYLFFFNPLKQVLSLEQTVSHVILYNHPAISSRKIHSYCSKKGIRVYADCTEWFDPQGFSFHDCIKRWDTWYRMRVVNKQLDGVIAISSYLDSYYRKAGCKTVRVPPLIDITDEKWTHIQSVKKGKIQLCYVGNPGAGTKDRLNILINTLRIIRSREPSLIFELIVVGMTASEYKDVFREDTNSYDFVSFLGRKPNQEALTIIKQSDFSVFLRDNNLICKAGFPTKFSESLACGTPVLTNITSDLGLYLIDGENGFVLNRESDESLIQTLENALSTDKETIMCMKKKCLESNVFDYHSFINVFKDLF